MQQVPRHRHSSGRLWRRRGLALVTAAVLAASALALTGCRSDPGIAAYVGSIHYSQDRVAGIADDAYTKLQKEVRSQSGKAGVSAPPVERPVTEQEVVVALVSRDVLKALAQEKHVSAVSIDPKQVARHVQLPPDAEYVKLLAEEEGYRQALMQHGPATAPSEADLREVYHNLKKASDGAYTDSFERFKSSLAAQDAQLVGRGAALRKDLQATATDLNVKINPRYAPAELSLIEISDQSGNVHPLLAVSFNPRDIGVRDQ